MYMRTYTQESLVTETNITDLNLSYYLSSSDNIQPNTLISDQSPSGLLLDINVTGI